MKATNSKQLSCYMKDVRITQKLSQAKVATNSGHSSGYDIQP